jgi:hypothetical protein
MIRTVNRQNKCARQLETLFKKKGKILTAEEYKALPISEVPMRFPTLIKFWRGYNLAVQYVVTKINTSLEAELAPKTKAKPAVKPAVKKEK